MGRLSGKKILIGVTGSIAAYKALILLRLLQKEGADIKVVMTEAAKDFVGELSFSTLTDTAVYSNNIKNNDIPSIPNINDVPLNGIQSNFCTIWKSGLPLSNFIHTIIIYY